MRIGLDATALPDRPVGAGMYMIQLIRALNALPCEHEWVVFAQKHAQALIGLPERPGFQWVILPDHSPAYRLAWEQTAFPRLVRQQRIDLLHSLHYTRPYLLPCPSVVTFHDLTFFLFPHLHTRSKRLFFPAAMRMSAGRSQALLAVSENTRQDAIRILKIPPEKIFTTPLGVSPDFHPIPEQEPRAAIRQRYHLPERFLLFVGVVEPRKNLPLLLKAYHRVVEQGVSLPLVIVGRMGWMYDQVLELIDSLGIKQQVLFAGYVPSQDLPIVYNLAEIFVYPSTYEGFGLPPLEALACGTPVITTAISSMPEHVGQAGLLVPPQDEAALSQAILKLLGDPALREHLHHAGPQQAAAFTWERTARETLKVYQKVLALK